MSEWPVGMMMVCNNRKKLVLHAIGMHRSPSPHNTRTHVTPPWQELGDGERPISLFDDPSVQHRLAVNGGVFAYLTIGSTSGEGDNAEQAAIRAARLKGQRPRCGSRVDVVRLTPRVEKLY